MSIWGRSKLAGGIRADEPEYISYGPLYDEDGPGDPEFGAWLDEKLGLVASLRYMAFYVWHALAKRRPA